MRRFRTPIRVIVLCTLCLVMSGAASAQEIATELRLVRGETWANVMDFFVADLDGDGKDEFFRLFADHRTYQANPFSREHFLGPALYQGNALYWISYVSPVQVDTLRGTEVAVALKDPTGDSVWLEIHAGFDKMMTLCRTEAIVGKDISDKGGLTPSQWDGHIYRCYADDINNDGAAELIVPMIVGFDLYPRGIYVYAYPSGKLLWSYLLAGNTFNLSIADANGDKFKEIYFKTWASANGAVVDGWADTTAYAFCLNHLGQALWRECLGDRFDAQTGDVLVCDCDGNDTTEIYYTVLVYREEYDKQIRVLEKSRAWDNFFLRQLSFDAVRQYHGVFPADVNGDGIEEIITDGSVSILRASDLAVLHAGEFREVYIPAVENMDGDKDNIPELALAKGDSLYITDSALNVRCAASVGEFGVTGGVEFFRSSFGKPYFGVFSGQRGISSANSLVIYEVAPVPPKTVWEKIAGTAVHHGPAVMVGCGLGLLMGFLLRPPSFSRRPRSDGETERYETLLATLVNFNHGQMAGRNMDRLLFLFSNIPDERRKLEELKPSLESAVKTYQSYSLPRLNDIINSGQRLKPLRSQVGRLAEHTVKLTTQLDTVSVRDVTLSEGQQLKSSVSDLLVRVKDDIRQIRSTVQRRFAANLLRVVPSVLSAAAGQLREQGISFESISTTGGTGQAAFFSEIELASIIEELLGNASDAMADSPVKSLSLQVRFQTDEVAIRLSDTGKGINNADPDKLFSRDYSTKGNDRGYGLYHARQLVERFGGRIRIYNNERPPGATVELVLKTVNDE